MSLQDAAKIVKWQGLDVAAFWVPSLAAADKVLSDKRTPQKRANFFGMGLKNYPWTEAPTEATFKAIVDGRTMTISKAVGTVHDAAQQVLKAQWELWKQGKQPTTPSPGLLALADPPVTSKPKAKTPQKQVAEAVKSEFDGDGSWLLPVAGAVAAVAAFVFLKKRKR